MQAYRSRISMRICTLAGTDAGGMVSAMLLGTKETLSEETDALLTHHGIRHVNCISTIDTVTSGHIYVEGKDITTLHGSQLADFRG